jgi:type II secretory pathway pseudopilin PulG
VGILAVAAGVAAYTLLPNQRYPDSEAGLRDYLAQVQSKQFEYQTQRQNFAAKLEDLQPLGLNPVPEGFTIDYRGSSPLDYCWLGKAQNVPVWFTLSKDGVKRTELPRDGAPPISCRR